MKSIVVLGGGFAGMTCVLDIEKRYRSAGGEVKIYLINEASYQEYHPNLYEIATSPEEITAMQELAHSVALPIQPLLEGKNITFVQGKVTLIDQDERVVHVGEHQVPYDYLVLALGAAPNFYGIPGVAERGHTLKSIADALKIRDSLESLIQLHRVDMTKDQLRVVVAGGGFAGVEVAAELQGFLDFVCWKNNFPREKTETLIVEGANRILPGLDDTLAKDVAQRLHDLSVRVQVNSMITKVDDHFVEFKNGERLEYDLLIWTAGVKAQTAPFKNPVAADRGDRLIADGTLRLNNSKDIFVIGDQACIYDSNQHPLPGTAPQAMYQAHYVADAISALMRGKNPKPFSCRTYGYIIPVGRKWAVLKQGPLYIKGWLAYVIRGFVAMHYFASVAGWWRAFKLVAMETKLYSRND